MKNITKEEIVLIIKEEWDNSRLGSYFTNNTPDWIKEIVPKEYISHPMDTIANNAANKILNML